MRNQKLLKKFKITVESIQKLFHSYQYTKYMLDKANDNWSETEIELETLDYPIQPEKYIFSPSVVTNFKINKETFPIASFDTTDNVVGTPFPLEAMMFLYCFTLIENYGNYLVDEVNPTFFKDEYNKKWHGKIHPDKNGVFNIPVIKNDVASMLKIQPSIINNKFLETLNEIRNRRNQLAHENSYPRNMLHKDINNILILMYSLYYYVTTDMDLISIFAWKE